MGRDFKGKNAYVKIEFEQLSQRKGYTLAAIDLFVGGFSLEQAEQYFSDIARQLKKYNQFLSKLKSENPDLDIKDNFYKETPYLYLEGDSVKIEDALIKTFKEFKPTLLSKGITPKNRTGYGIAKRLVEEMGGTVKKLKVSFPENIPQKTKT
ncbi:MAG: hypothetical protein KAS04_01890 [Candidatus Aenigmarchaeota archaeon]|nr:hypothetical protein [Candidatus Aenigmarchaeota archaeon]